MNIKNYYYSILTILTVILLSLISSSSWSANLSFRAEQDSAPGKIQLVVDHVEKLAGMKITINYDGTLLAFVKAEKSTATASFLHVVNDKSLGKIIIVMASANGISGDSIPLLHLFFSRQEMAQKSSARISVSQVQLMDENLKEIPADQPDFLFQPKLP